MTIDFEKLQDLEHAAEKEHLALLALHEKRREALAELSRQRLAIWIGPDSKVELLRQFVEDVAYDADKFRDGMKGINFDQQLVDAVYRRLQLIGRYQAIADGAARRYELQERRWQDANAALPALREFAERVAGRPIGGRVGVRADAAEGAHRGASFFGGR